MKKAILYAIMLTACAHSHASTSWTATLIQDDAGYGRAGPAMNERGEGTGGNLSPVPLKSITINAGEVLTDATMDLPWLFSHGGGHIEATLETSENARMIRVTIGNSGTMWMQSSIDGAPPKTEISSTLNNLFQQSKQQSGSNFHDVQLPNDGKKHTVKLSFKVGLDERRAIAKVKLNVVDGDGKAIPWPHVIEAGAAENVDISGMENGFIMRKQRQYGTNKAHAEGPEALIQYADLETESKRIVGKPLDLSGASKNACAHIIDAGLVVKRAGLVHVGASSDLAVYYDTFFARPKDSALGLYQMLPTSWSNGITTTTFYAAKPGIYPIRFQYMSTSDKLKMRFWIQMPGEPELRPIRADETVIRKTTPPTH